ncbi:MULTISPECIES: restriction endonuclease subunit S [Bradyrhizobium]|uniref:restriction endonuclease subunit S n=1 Tax=Bradyrhizobium TaxID=374 RepID=UPI00155EEADD|nr:MULTISPECIES: restriction endonuclease subunit S [Bradyrhizobium]MDD1522118.1 hypothetical protein [Bradyrhizobium sp. WBAH30]MDD1541454.1 hypothetical protein [Bradyrhizobium sp. WBAH41]MDD1556922.1 hypothetical protein [Bradyrhizobium sp. WBAH23]MDD1564723.1 hypothetical protein [Bradyrhizobium sp. WBAH33]MDD1589724.1 hypothetical protein [Bradyrhizobium sp. WBAH42]
MSFSASVSELVEKSQSGLLGKAPYWERIPLGEIAKILNGYPWKSTFFNGQQGVPVVRIRDVTSGATETLYSGPVEEGFWIEDGDLLVGMDGDFNSRIWMAGRALLNQRVCRIAPDENVYLKAFLAIVLPGYLKLINSETHSTTVKHLSSKTLCEIPLPFPSLPEQRRIVAKVESLSAKSRRASDHLDHIPRLVEKYKQAILAAAFRGELTREWRDVHPDANAQISREDLLARTKTPKKPRAIAAPTAEQRRGMWSIPKSWRWRQVGEVGFVTKLAGFEYTKYVQYDPDGDLRVLKAENAGPNGFRPTAYSRVRSETVEQLERSRLSGGELLVVFVGAGTGNVAVVPPSDAFFLGPNVGMVRPTSEITARFMELFFRYHQGRQLLLATSKAVAQPSLSMGAIRSTPIAVSSLAEQSEIINRIETAFAWIDRLLYEAASARKLCNRLNEAVLAKAFRGELVPQDHNDELGSDL